MKSGGAVTVGRGTALGTIVEIWFIIIILMVVAGIALRIFVRTLPPVQLHKVAPASASRLVSDFIASSYETDFGYPSGYFRIEQATDTEVVAREWVTKGSHFTQILRGFYRAVLSLGAPFGCDSMCKVRAASPVVAAGARAIDRSATATAATATRVPPPMSA